jgi:hypothetical protein
MIRELALGGAFVITALAVGSASAWAAECRNGRSTDPNCYRANGYVCGPCQDDRDDRRGDAEASVQAAKSMRGSPSSKRTPTLASVVAFKAQLG